jgi:hypothetical protein
LSNEVEVAVAALHSSVTRHAPGPRFGPHLQPHSLQAPGASHFLVFCSKLLLLHMLLLPLV